jgi:hypothetical protein
VTMLGVQWKPDPNEKVQWMDDSGKSILSISRLHTQIHRQKHIQTSQLILFAAAKTESDKCLICSELWSSARRRHHCRQCGRLVCNNCSPFKVPYKHDTGKLRPERCCEDCYDEIMRKKTVSVPKALYGEEEVAWMKNNASKKCTRCEKKFTLSVRRHHCRHCGDLVCQECSLHRVKVEADNLMQNGGDASEAQRCCDTCFENLKKLRKAEVDAEMKRKQELDLLNSTSRVSSCLLKIFFLDGSTKTVKYSENTTVEEIVDDLCHSVKPAVFQVKRNIKNPSDFILVKPCTPVTDVLRSWDSDNSMKSAKLVLPFYDVKLIPRLAGFKAADKASKKQAATVFRADPSNDSTVDASLLSLELRSFSVDELQGKLKDLQQNYETMSKKYDALKEIQKTKQKRQSSTMYADMMQRLSVVDQAPIADIYDLDTSRQSGSYKIANGDFSSYMESLPADPNPIIKTEATEEIKVPNEEDISGSYKSDSGNLSVNMFDIEEANGIDVEDGPDEINAAPSSPGSGKLLDNAQTRINDCVIHGWLKYARGTFFKKQYAVLSTDGIFLLYSSELAGWPNKTFNINKKLYSKQHEKQISIKFDDESRIYLQCATLEEANDWCKALNMVMETCESDKVPTPKVVPVASLLLPLETSSHQSSRGDILNRPTTSGEPLSRQSSAGKYVYRQISAFDEIDVKAIAKSSSSSEGKMQAFRMKLSEISLLFLSFDDMLKEYHAKTSNLDAPELTNVCEMVDEMKELYGTFMDYGEDWVAGTKKWMVDLLRENLQLPVRDPMLLSAVLQLHGSRYNEHSAHAVQASILQSFLDGVPANRHTTEGVIKLVNNIVKTMNLVIHDLVPQLPKDFQVITMFTEQAHNMIREDIKTFYASNKASMRYQDMLTLLSFADQQKYELSKFKVDTSYLNEFYFDLLKQYKNEMQRLMREWIGRILFRDETAEVEVGPSGALTRGGSNWPIDLIDCLSDQIGLAVTQLRTNARDIVIKTILDEVPDFAVQQHRWLDAKLGILEEDNGVSKGGWFSSGKAASMRKSIIAEAMPDPASLSAAQMIPSGESSYLLTIRMTNDGGQGENLIERVSAYVNNMYRFISLLSDREALVLNEISTGITLPYAMTSSVMM